MNARRAVARAAAFDIAVLLVACSTPSDRVILLPGTAERPTGAVSVRAPKGELVLTEAYAQADVVDGAVAPTRSSAEKVQADYGALLELRPPSARTWVLYFEAGGSQLTAESRRAMDELRAALASYEGGDLVVTGHTDRVGDAAENDRLSLNRARSVHDLLVAAGVPASSITVSGRGERAPAVPTADEVAEPRNRRVEVKLR